MSMYSWIHPSLVQKASPKEGDGIFATTDLPTGTRLAVFGGYVMTLEEEAGLDPVIADCAHQIDDDLVIGVREPGKKQIVDNFNHSCLPNAGFKGQIFLVAMQPIGAGEEVTFDYAMTVSGEPAYSFDCLCGVDSCRRTVSSEDWKRPELQQKYAGYFQYYLQEKIDKLSHHAM